jgi:hypothetical protein
VLTNSCPGFDQVKTVFIGGITGGLSDASQIRREDHGAQMSGIREFTKVFRKKAKMIFNVPKFV